MANGAASPSAVKPIKSLLVYWQGERSEVRTLVASASLTLDLLKASVFVIGSAWRQAICKCCSALKLLTKIITHEICRLTTMVPQHSRTRAADAAATILTSPLPSIPQRKLRSKRFAGPSHHLSQRCLGDPPRGPGMPQQRSETRWRHALLVS